MQLDVVFNPHERPEVQHQLRVIPDSARVDHEQLKTALQLYEGARKAEREARQALAQLETELPTAEHQDQIALANARVAGAKDPGGRAAERHRKAIDEAGREWGASKILLGRSIENVVQAFAEHGDAYEAELLDERDRLRSAMA